MARAHPPMRGRQSCVNARYEEDACGVLNRRLGDLGDRAGTGFLVQERDRSGNGDRVVELRRREARAIFGIGNLVNLARSGSGLHNNAAPRTSGSVADSKILMRLGGAWE